MNGRQPLDQPVTSRASPAMSASAHDEVDRDAADAVDPRVQVELERLNTATDDINKLEVDLDDSRVTFRELLCESTYAIDAIAKKLGNCIGKSRPYYEARFKAKEALVGAQKAAIKFERANSQHAAAKEMVYLAEEGLKTEGRSFDHAWQEMLNHATSRVNESERERAICEVEHRQTTALYHKAEYNVQRLQKDLKRAISKSRPYYEMKAHFNQNLEQQKVKVTALEKSVADAKMTYAETLRNLEKISDEIHRTRRFDDDLSCNRKVSGAKSTSTASKAVSTDSSTTESPDSTDDTSDEYLRLPDKLNSITNSALPNVEASLSSDYPSSNSIHMQSLEPRRYIKRDRPNNIATVNSTSNLPDVMKVLSPCRNTETQTPKMDTVLVPNGEEWTEINLTRSPIDLRNEGQIPYKLLGSDLKPELSGNVSKPNIKPVIKKLITQRSLPAMSEVNELSPSKNKTSEVTRSPSFKKKINLDGKIATWMSRNPSSSEASLESSATSSRRQSLDIWNSGTGERVKEFLNHGMMMLNISNLTERRYSEPKILENDKDKVKLENAERVESKGRKVPSPLEKTLNYLNVEDESSDNESLASNEMLTEDQISSLMMEPDVNQVCQEILGTPLVEVCPTLQKLQQQQ